MRPSRALFRDSVTRVRAPLVTDEYGTASAARNWAAAVSTVIHHCAVQPVAGLEFDLNREAIISRWRLFAPCDAAIEATDRIVWCGATYEVDGYPQVWASHYLAAYLKRVTG